MASGFELLAACVVAGQPNRLYTPLLSFFQIMTLFFS
jgi:hypothetical protein